MVDKEIHKKKFKTISKREEILAFKVIEKFEDFFVNLNWNVTPRYHFEKDVLIVEDLEQERYKNAVLKKYFVYETLKLVAKLHATSIAYEDKKCKLNDLINDNSTIEDWVQNDLNCILEKMPNSPLSKDNFKEQFALFFKNSTANNNKDNNALNVLSHGNLIPKNIFFKYENAKVVSAKLINFETYYKPNALDVLYFIYNATTPYDRQNYLENYLQYYYKYLKQELFSLNVNIETVLTVRQFEECCKKILPLIKLLTTLRNIKKSILDTNSLDIDDKEILLEIEEILENNLITIEDCFKIVTKKLASTNYSIVNYKLEPFSEKNGFLGEHAILKIQTEFEQKVTDLTFFVKLLPNVQSQREFAVELDVYFKESNFFIRYMQLLNSHNINVLNEVVPSCYFALNEILVLDDLKLKGYETMDSRISLNFDCVQSGLKALAKLHSSCFILEEIISRKNSQTYRLVDEFREEIKETFYSGKMVVSKAFLACKHGFNALIDVIDDIKVDKEDLKKFTHKAIDDQPIYAKSSEIFRNTICHGDLWTKNLMFKFTETDKINCVLLDFQTYRYAPPAQDVLAYIRLVTDKTTRDKFLNNFLSFYYDQLRSNLQQFQIDINEVLKESEFYESLKYYTQFNLIQTITHYQTILLSEEAIKEVFSDPDRARFVMFHNKYDFTENVFRKDPVYRHRLTEAILEVEEFYRNNVAKSND